MNRFQEDRIEKLSCTDGVQRDIRIWEPASPKAVFLAVHGAMSHAGNYMEFALSMKEKGFATVAHDQQGHDRKHLVYVSRFEGFLDDMELMIDRVEAMYPDLPIFIVSHSMGGLVMAHYGLKRFTGDPRVKGFITSSPYWVNAVKIPWVVEKAAGLLSVVAPRMKVPIEDIRDYVTHDKKVMDRQREDVADDYMASGSSARFGSELLKSQAWLSTQIQDWKYPLLAIIAGDDKLADGDGAREMLGLIDSSIVTELYYPENFHENFNEMNREEIFVRIIEWMEPLMK